MDLTVLVPIVVATALIFDFTNGFHDTANAMATSIASGALRPRVAVALSAILNLVGAFLSVEVAKTISGGLIDEQSVGPAVVFGGLVGAIVWNLLTWYFGLPSSSSHALFGGLIGATLVAAGGDAVRFGRLVDKVLVPAVAAPVIAAVAGMVATYLACRITKGGTISMARSGFRVGQVASASLLSLAHGTNDAQKTMGVITLTLISAGSLPAGSGPPTWVIVSAGAAIAIGTYLGGWRIVRAMGKGITDIGIPQGFAAQTSATAVILSSSHLGIALSTTHVASGGIVGAGLGTPNAHVQWRTARRMVMAWLLTLPAAGLAGAAAGWMASTGVVGTVLVIGAGLVVGVGVYVASRRDPVSAHNVNDIPVQPVETPTMTPLGG